MEANSAPHHKAERDDEYERREESSKLRFWIENIKFSPNPIFSLQYFSPLVSLAESVCFTFQSKQTFTFQWIRFYLFSHTQKKSVFVRSQFTISSSLLNLTSPFSVYESLISSAIHLSFCHFLSHIWISTACLGEKVILKFVFMRGKLFREQYEIFSNIFYRTRNDVNFLILLVSELCSLPTFQTEKRFSDSPRAGFFYIFHRQILQICQPSNLTLFFWVKEIVAERIVCRCQPFHS